MRVLGLLVVACSSATVREPQKPAVAIDTTDKPPFLASLPRDAKVSHRTIALDHVLRREARVELVEPVAIHGCTCREVVAVDTHFECAATQACSVAGYRFVAGATIYWRWGAPTLWGLDVRSLERAPSTFDDLPCTGFVGLHASGRVSTCSIAAGVYRGQPLKQTTLELDETGKATAARGFGGSSYPIKRDDGTIYQPD